MPPVLARIRPYFGTVTALTTALFPPAADVVEGEVVEEVLLLVELQAATRIATTPRPLKSRAPRRIGRPPARRFSPEGHQWLVMRVDLPVPSPLSLNVASMHET